MTEREKLLVLYNRWITLAQEAQDPMERVVLSRCARELHETLYGRS